MTTMISPRPGLSPEAQRLHSEFERRDKIDRRIARYDFVLYLCLGMFLMGLMVVVLSSWGI